MTENWLNESIFYLTGESRLCTISSVGLTVVS
jgi:hypothetical protein